MIMWLRAVVDRGLARLTRFRFERVLSVSGLLLFLCACATPASGPVFTRTVPTGGRGVVHIYRPSSVSDGTRTIYLSVPREAGNCFALENEGYLSYEAEPGVI